MAQQERALAAGNGQRPQLVSTTPILTGLAALEKSYLKDLASLCHEAALTDDPAVLDATIRQFESVPTELRRLRAERLQLSREHRPWRRM